ALPKSRNGKLDRRALPATDFAQHHSVKTISRAPRTDAERKLAKIWEQKLNVSGIGIDDDFFDLGGDSLLAMRMFVQIRSEFGKALPLSTLFRAPTIKALAPLLDEKKNGADEPSTLVTLQPNGSEAALFCIHGGDGGTLVYRALSEHFGADRPLHALEAPWLAGGTMHETVEEMAAFYINQIQRVQRRGPYHLAGYSLGGVVAYEMAQQLRAKGEEVGLIVLFDSYNPGRPPRRLNLRERIAMNRRLANGMNLGGTLRLLADRAFGKVLANVSREKGRVNKMAARVLDQAKAPLSADLRLVRGREVSERAWADYRPQQYDGPVLVFIADNPHDGYEYKADRGWNGFATNLDLFRIDGAVHETMLYKPHVAKVAKKIRTALLECAQNGATVREAAQIR